MDTNKPKGAATESNTIGNLRKKIILLLSKIHCSFDVSLPKTLGLEIETVLSPAL